MFMCDTLITVYIYTCIYINIYHCHHFPRETPNVYTQIWWAMYDGWEMLWNVLNTKHNISQCVEYCFEKTSRSIQTSICTPVLTLQFVGFKRSQPCMNGMVILNNRVRKNVPIFSLMVVKPPGYNGDAVRISFPSAPLSTTGRAGASTWNCISSPSTETAAEGRAEGSNSRRNSRCCSYTRTRTKTQSRNRHQLQFQCAGTRQAAHRIAETASRLPEQAPPHESAPAAPQQKHQQKEQQMLLMPPGPNETQSRNWHQLQLKCAGARQAAHRIAEAASTNGRASTSTWNCISSP